MILRKLFVAACAVTAISFCVGHQSADAALQIRVTVLSGDGAGSTYTITDQDLLPALTAGKDSNPIAGWVANGNDLSIGSYLVDVNGLSDPFGANNPYSAQLHLDTLAVSNVGSTTGTIRIELTDTDFSIIPDASGMAIVNSSIGGFSSVGVVVSAKQIIDLGNDAFGSGSGVGATYEIVNAPPPLGPGMISNTQVAFIGYTGGLFSITEFVEVTLAPGSNMSFDFFSTVTTPEPVSLVAWGMFGLVGLAVARRRRISS